MSVSDQPTRLGRDAAHRLRLPGPPERANSGDVAGPRRRAGLVGALARSSMRFAASTTRPVEIRRALAAAAPVQVHRTGRVAMAPPRWWVPAEIAIAGLPGDSSAEQLPPRGLPRAVRRVPNQETWSPGGIASNLVGAEVRVRRLAEVAAVGKLAPESKLSATAVRAESVRRARERAAAEAASALAASRTGAAAQRTASGAPSTPAPPREGAHTAPATGGASPSVAPGGSTPPASQAAPSAPLARSVLPERSGAPPQLSSAATAGRPGAMGAVDRAGWASGHVAQPLAPRWRPTAPSARFASAVRRVAAVPGQASSAGPLGPTASAATITAPRPAEGGTQPGAVSGHRAILPSATRGTAGLALAAAGGSLAFAAPTVRIAPTLRRMIGSPHALRPSVRASALPARAATIVTTQSAGGSSRSPAESSARSAPAPARPGRTAAPAQSLSGAASPDHRSPATAPAPASASGAASPATTGPAIAPAHPTPVAPGATAAIGPAAAGTQSTGPASTGPASTGPASTRPASTGPASTGTRTGAAQHVNPALSARTTPSMTGPAGLTGGSPASHTAPAAAVTASAVGAAAALPGVISAAPARVTVSEPAGIGMSSRRLLRRLYRPVAELRPATTVRRLLAGGPGRAALPVLSTAMGRTVGARSGPAPAGQTGTAAAAARGPAAGNDPGRAAGQPASARTRPAPTATAPGSAVASPNQPPASVATRAWALAAAGTPASVAGTRLAAIAMPDQLTLRRASAYGNAARPLASGLGPVTVIRPSTVSGPAALRAPAGSAGLGRVAPVRVGASADVPGRVEARQAAGAPTTRAAAPAGAQTTVGQARRAAGAGTTGGARGSHVGDVLPATGAGAGTGAVLRRSFVVAPPPVSITPVRRRSGPPVPETARPAAAATTLETGRPGAQRSRLYSAAAALFAAAGGPSAVRDQGGAPGQGGSGPVPSSGGQPMSESLPVIRRLGVSGTQQGSSARDDTAPSIPTMITRSHDAPPAPIASRQLDELVDLVVERIEARVVDELERRGRRTTGW